jgi:hypothetical protein
MSALFVLLYNTDSYLSKRAYSEIYDWKKFLRGRSYRKEMRLEMGGKKESVLVAVFQSHKSFPLSAVCRTYLGPGSPL